MRVKRPDNRLTLTEFIACLVRVAFLRANPKYGQVGKNDGGKNDFVLLPGCPPVAGAKALGAGLGAADGIDDLRNTGSHRGCGGERGGTFPPTACRS